MSILARGLLDLFIVTQGYGSFFEGDSNVGTLSLSVENVVSPTDKYVPLTGLHSTEKDITGWIFDRRRVEDWDSVRTRYNSFLGGHTSGLRDGTVSDHWQSGITSSIDYFDLANYRIGDFRTWTPRVVTGSYALHWDERNLYSDYSYSENVDINQNVGGLNVVTLRDDALHHTIQAAIWERRDNFQIFKAKEYVYVDEFTGEIDTVTDTRKATEDSEGNFLVDNFSSRKREFTIRSEKAWFNADHQINVGYTNPALSLAQTLSTALVDLWEDKGEGRGSGRDLFTKYFPVQVDSVRVISESNSSANEWTEVETLNFSEPTDRHYVVDYDLGIITVGGYQAPDLVVREDVLADDVEIPVFIDDEAMEQYPEQGVITIGTEEILYYSKTRNAFIDCVRGYNSTTSLPQSQGAIVKDRQHGLGSTDTFYVSYLAVPRVDYEVTDYNKRSANKASWLDVRPARNATTTNVLQILSSQLNLAEIVLETDSPLIGGNIHGPVFYGTDISRLTARGLDAAGNPVDGIPLTIEILAGVGALNGAGTSYRSISNTLGEIYAFYNAPYTSSTIESIVSQTTHDGADTLMTVPNLQTSVDLEDVWVYQILKHDKTLGSVGLKREVTAEDLTVSIPHGNSSLTIDGLVNKEDYTGGWLYITGTDGVRRYRRILTMWEDTDGSGRPVSVVGLSSVMPAGTSVGQPVWLFKSDEKEWNPVIKNGSRVILYEFSTSALHPITGVTGAFAPIHPDSISGNTLRFNGRNLPIPDANDVENNVGAYSVIAPSEVSLQAYGIDPASGRIVRSNTIRLELNLPNFLTGVDSSGVLPIPYGWTLVTEESNIGAGLGGANFITVNPNADGINQFSLTGII